MLADKIILPESPSRRSRLALMTGLSMIVMVAVADQLIVSPNYESLIADGVYEDSKNWRQPQDDEYGWRQTEKSKQSRITWGYDPAYEAMRAKKSEDFSSKSFGYEQTKPSSLFRIDF